MKTPANHPWKSKPAHRKVKAECAACGKEFARDPETSTYTCSDQCMRDYRKVKRIMHMTRGGFR